MRPNRLGVLCALMMAAAVMAGCETTGDLKPSGNGNTSAASPPASPAAPALDAKTKGVCTAVAGDVASTAKKVASAEKIGPPAGHSAVSAEYSAGAAAIYAHMFDANAKVSDAAKQVATAMTDLADKWATNPKKAPAKTGLTTAVTQFKAACAGA